MFTFPVMASKGYAKSTDARSRRKDHSLSIFGGPKKSTPYFISHKTWYHKTSGLWKPCRKIVIFSFFLSSACKFSRLSQAKLKEGVGQYIRKLIKDKIFGTNMEDIERSAWKSFK